MAVSRGENSDRPMSSVFCTSCGAPAPAGAAFCSYCGSPIVGGPRAAAGAPPPPPIPSAPPAMPPGGYGYPYPPVRAPRRRRTWVVVVVVIVVVILLVGVLALVTSPPAIDVTGINFVSPDNVCGLAGETSYGFNGTAGQNTELSFQIFNGLPNNATVGCTMSTLTASTPGFSVSGANLPLTVPPGENSSQILSFQVNFPSNGYTGVLTLVVT